MNQDVSAEEKLEELYQKARTQLESIRERHKKEIDEYIAELDREQIQNLRKELSS